MKKISLVILLLIFIQSCSTQAKYKWYYKDVAPNKRVWRWCDQFKDGSDAHNKGICYISQRCRKRFLARPKCESVSMFCKHGDVKCLERNGWPSVKRGH